MFYNNLIDGKRQIGFMFPEVNAFIWVDTIGISIRFKSVLYNWIFKAENSYSGKDNLCKWKI
jgi:hypothetical protein